MSDPTAEERIAELERQVAELTAGTQGDEESTEARDKARPEKKNERGAPVNRLRLGLATTNPKTKENDR